jgi:hypothetical protein
MKKLLYIRSLAIAALLLLLLAVAPAAADNVTYQGETTTLAVVAEPDCNYKWELYNDATGNFVDKPGNALPSEAVFVGSPNQPSVDVRWLTPGIYYYKVTVSDITGCSANMKIGRMEVKEAKPTATITSDHQSICDGETATIEIMLTGKGPWDLTYSDDTGNLKTITGITDSNYELEVSPMFSTQFFITEVKDQNAVNELAEPYTTVWVFVTDRPVFVRKIHAVEP